VGLLCLPPGAGPASVRLRPVGQYVPSVSVPKRWDAQRLDPACAPPEPQPRAATGVAAPIARVSRRLV